MTTSTKKFTRPIAALTLTILTIASIASGNGRDNNPQNAGETQSRNSWGLTLDGAMGNPALVGLDRPPRGGLSLLPFSVALWSDKLAPPLDLSILTNTSGYLTKLMRESFGLESNLSPEQVSEKLTRELRGGIGLYAGMKASPVVFATRGFGLNFSTFADADARIPGGLLLPFFSDTAGLLAGKRLDLSDTRLNAIWASEIALKIGYSMTVPFFSDYLGLNFGAAGAGIKVLFGHAYMSAEMEKGGALSYDTASNKYKIDARLNMLSAGTGLYGDKKNSLAGDLMNINGQGCGFDLGTVFHNNKHALSVDVQDIGMILWNGKEVRRGGVTFDREFDLDDMRLGMEGLFDFDALKSDNKNYILWLPASLNVGYAYGLRFDGDLGIFLGYLAANLGYNQQLVLGVGRDTYLPRLSAGAAFGLLAGYLPVRCGLIYGGPERLASSIGVGLDAKNLSIDAFYKAVGSPALQPARGFEIGGGLTFRWGFRRSGNKVKDAPEDAAEAARADTATEPDMPAVSEFFPDEDDSAETIYEPIEINMAMSPPEQKPESKQEPEPKQESKPEPLPQPTEEESKELGVSQRAINFMPGGATLTESSLAPLKAIADLLARYPHIRYEVQGHTDSHGAEMYNLLLSAERAAVVKYYLMSLGAPESSLVAVGYGKNIPIADNNTPVGRALNRRVEFVPIQSQEHYDWVKRFELEMIPRLTDRVIWGKKMMEPKKEGE